MYLLNGRSTIWIQIVVHLKSSFSFQNIKAHQLEGRMLGAKCKGGKKCRWYVWRRMNVRVRRVGKVRDEAGREGMCGFRWQAEECGFPL